MFDVNELESFKNLKNWILSVNENVGVSIPIIVIGNKIDLDKKVISKEIKQFQREHKIEIFECSAKSGENTSEAFCYVIKEVLDYKKKKEKVKLEEFNIDVLPSNSECKC